MALINVKSLEDWRNLQLAKWQELKANANINTDSMIFIDATVIAEVLYLMQLDAVILNNNAFLAYATGDELTNLGADRGVTRILAEPSTGTVRFSRETLAQTDFSIGVDTIVSTQPDGNGQVVAFQVTSPVVLYGQILAPNAPLATLTTTGGTIGNGTYDYVVTAVSVDLKETEQSTSVVQVISNGLSTNKIDLSWDAVSRALKYNVYIKVGGIYKKLSETTSPSYTDTVGTSASTTNPPTENETGNLYIDAPVECTLGGTFGNVAVNTVTAFIKKPSGIENVTNNSAFSGGTDLEDDETYRARIKSALSNNVSKTTTTGYQNTALSVTGVASAKAEKGAGINSNIINIYITADNETGIPDAGLIADVQAELDKDENHAPCDSITVVAPSVLDVDISITITEIEQGASEATITQLINDALVSFFKTLGVNATIRVVDLINLIHNISGVVDFTLDDPVANISLGTTEMATLGALTVTYA